MLMFSIILPVRNGGDYFKQCVQAILAQSYPHFNLLVLENGSTDDTLHWIKQQTDSRIHVFPSEQPLTIEENWARITALSKNEFITLIGHDDILHADYLQEMVNLINQYPEASLYQTQFDFIDSNGKFIRKCLPMQLHQTGAELLSAVLKGEIDINGTGYMMRSKDYDMLNGIPAYPNLLFADFELWIKLTSISGKVTSSKTCFSYRLHQSMTAVSSDQKFQEAFGRFMLFLLQIKAESSAFHTVLESYVGQFIGVYAKSFSHRLLRTPLDSRNNLQVKNWLEKCQYYADKLLGSNVINVQKNWSIKLSKVIDNYAVLRNAFLLFKKWFPKPIFK